MSKEPRGWYVSDRIEAIRRNLFDLEWEMTGAHFVGDRAEEMAELAERLSNLAKADKGIKPQEMKDAA